MHGLVSFHPVDPAFFARLIEPLVAGDKANPEAFLDAALYARASAAQARCYKVALTQLVETLVPPPPPEAGSLWDKVRTRLERFDFKADPLAVTAKARLETDLHLAGRPFLITEGSAERVSVLVDEYLAARGATALGSLILEQLVRLDPALGRVEPAELEEPEAEMAYRNALLSALRQVYELGQAARRGEEPARALAAELPWRAVFLHSRAGPFWLAHDVDGLETICRAAEVEPPSALAPAGALFARSCEAYPRLRESLGLELRRERDVAAYVAPDKVPELLSFLNLEGARIIKAATRHGEGAVCATLLRKIRECAHYAERHGLGYLEASGIGPLEDGLGEGSGAD